MTPPRFRPCEAFAAGAALLDAPHRAVTLRAAGLLDAFPAGPMRQYAFLVSEVPGLVDIDPTFVFEDRATLAWLVRQLRDPRSPDDAQRIAFGDVVDLDAIERLVAQWTQPLAAAVRTDGRVLLDELDAFAAAEATRRAFRHAQGATLHAAHAAYLAEGPRVAEVA